jgi:hypothetical protein
MQEILPTNLKFNSSSYNHDDARNDSKSQDEAGGESIVLSFCMNIDWGNDEFQGEKSTSTPKNKIRSSQSLLLPNAKVDESTRSKTRDRSSFEDRDDQSKQEMRIFRRLSDSLHGVVSRFTHSSSNERENSSSTLRDEDFYWLSSSNSWMSQSTTSDSEKTTSNIK